MLTASCLKWDKILKRKCLDVGFTFFDVNGCKYCNLALITIYTSFKYEMDYNRIILFLIDFVNIYTILKFIPVQIVIKFIYDMDLNMTVNVRDSVLMIFSHGRCVVCLLLLVTGVIPVNVFELFVVDNLKSILVTFLCVVYFIEF